MSEPRPADNLATRAVVERYLQEYNRVQSEEKEIAMLIRQTEGEIDRGTQRLNQALQQVQEMEANLDHYSRQEIASGYQAAHEAELRLGVIKAHLEQLQAKMESLQRYKAALQDLLPLVQAYLSLRRPLEPAPSPGPPAAKTSAINIIQAQEAERQRLSRQMHDGPAQALTNLILQAEICERLLARDPAQAKEELANLKSMVHAAFQQIRSFIFDLRPMILDDLGLAPTLRKYVQGFQERTNIATSLTVLGQDRRLPEAIEVALFRSVQEALANVADHAQATHAQVTLDLQDEAAVRVLIEDNGQGFDVANVVPAARERHTLGIASILDRLEALGGRAHFESAPGKGTRVHLEVPVTYPPDPKPGRSSKQDAGGD